jgi:hypothetical protein
MSERELRYVANDDIPKWEAVGWHNTQCLIGTHHSANGDLMEWRGEGEPQVPDPEREKEEA